MVDTITEPTGDELTKLVFQKRLAKNVSQDLLDDTKYAVCLLRLNPAVVVPDDYPALKTAIEAVSGIAEITLLIDHQTKATVPTDHTQVVQIRANVDLRDDSGP